MESVRDGELNILAPVSSKFPQRRSKNEFYRYYAGYPLEFAEWGLGRLGLRPNAVILDPWNGSGTTAAACARTGNSCQGYDINPVMVHLARARLASRGEVAEAEDLVVAVEEALRGAAKVNLRIVGLAFRDLPVGNEVSHSVAIASLFPYARSILSLQKTKNPSWYRKGASFDDVTLDRSDFITIWLSLIKEISQWRSVQDDVEGISISIERGDSRKSLGRKDSFDGVFTSPPYLTRLDYVQATLPEFLLLREFDMVPDLMRLRRSMLGSPLTSDRPGHDVARLPVPIQALLKRIAEHSSKASASYYHRFFSTYFVDLRSSIRNIAHVVRPSGAGCMVVQSSNYKEIRVDLASSVVEIGREFGLQHFETVEFRSKRSISLVNTRAHIDAREPKSEYAVFFRKE